MQVRASDPPGGPDRTHHVAALDAGPDRHAHLVEVEVEGEEAEPVVEDHEPTGEEVLGDERDALQLANRSRYGLGGAIFSKDVEKAERLAARELEAGFTVVNGSVVSDPRLPFGGVKLSGYGRELGSFGLREFVNVKTVVVSA